MAPHKGETLELIPIGGVWRLPSRDELRAWRMAQAERAMRDAAESTKRTTQAFEDLGRAFEGFAFASGGFTRQAQAHAQKAHEETMGKLRERLKRGPITMHINLGGKPRAPKA